MSTSYNKLRSRFLQWFHCESHARFGRIAPRFCFIALGRLAVPSPTARCVLRTHSSRFRISYSQRYLFASRTSGKSAKSDAAVLLTGWFCHKVTIFQRVCRAAPSHEQLINCVADFQYRTSGTTGTVLDCDFCVAKCERINNFSVTLLEVPSYVYEGTYRTATGSSPRMHGNIEPGLKGQRDTAMQPEQTIVHLLRAP